MLLNGWEIKVKEKSKNQIIVRTFANWAVFSTSTMVSIPQKYWILISVNHFVELSKTNTVLRVLHKTDVILIYQQRNVHIGNKCCMRFHGKIRCSIKYRALTDTYPLVVSIILPFTTLPRFLDIFMFDIP